jgi:hypothetical protein
VNGVTLLAQPREERSWARVVRQRSQRTDRFVRARAQAPDHVIGVDSNTFQLFDQCS